MNHKRAVLLDVPIDDISLSDALSLSETWLRAGSFHHVVTPGPEFLLEASDHPRFRRILQQADLSLPDGIGLKLGFLLTGRNLRHRTPGADYVEGLLKLAARQRYSIFLFGARPISVAEEAAKIILKRFPGVRLAGIEPGVRWPWSPLQGYRIAERIHAARPDILLVALGAPKQELWIESHRHLLHDVKIAVGIGRTLDYISGRVNRAHPAVRRLGLEWLNTWIFASRYHQGPLRRQRVHNATWGFLRKVITR